MPTLLERFTKNGMTYGTNKGLPYIATFDEIRRALAIAQAVDEVDNTGDYALAVCHEYMRFVMRRADELLEEEK